MEKINDIYSIGDIRSKVNEIVDKADKKVNFTCTVKDNNAKNYHHILSSEQCKNGWTDKTITLLVTQNSNDAGLGILRCSLRTNNIKNNEVAEGEIIWLIRTGFAESSFCFNLRNTPGDTYMDIFYKASSTYMGLTWYVLSEGAMATDEELWIKYNTDATYGTNVYTESEMNALREYTSTLVFSEDKGVVDQANDAYWADEAYKATKAIQDDDGNVITDTYTTKEYVENLYKNLPTKTSQLENDSEFVTATQLNSKAPAYQYSTTDLTAGVSELATGTIYIVYE